MNAVDHDRPAFRPDARGGHVESWFLRLNAPDGSRALWVRWTLFVEKHAEPRAECWALAFERGRAPRGGKRSFALAHDAIRHDPFELVFDGNRFDGTHAEGSVRTASSEVTFAIDLTPRLAPLSPFPYDWMYRTPLPESKLKSPIPDAIARGFYVLDGERIDVTGWRAMHGHNWGTRNAYRYAWCHGFGFDDAPDVVFEGFSARLLKGGVELPWLSIGCLFVDDRWLRFDRPAAIRNARADASVMRWNAHFEHEGTSLDVEAAAPTSETVALFYANPDAAATYCLNSKLASLRMTLREGGRTRTFSTRMAAFEIGWPSADHGIAMIA